MNEVFKMLIIYYWERIVLDGKEYDYFITEFGDIKNSNGKILKIRKNNRGYKIVDLYYQGIKKTFLVHRLVALTFIPNPKNYKTVDHINGDKNNNSVDNLEWVSYSENNTRALNNKLRIPLYGEQHQFSKYTEKDVEKICEYLTKNLSVKEISIKTDYPISLIASIKCGKSWRHISKKYQFVESRYYMNAITRAKIIYLYTIEKKGIKDILEILGWENKSKYIKRIKRVLEKHCS